MLLYGYWRSSAAYRVRIALNLKGMRYEQRSINLVKGEQRSGEYLSLNPQGRVPTLCVDDTALSQSLSIIEWLDETIPMPPLLPGTALERARVRALAQLVACEIHPPCNLNVKAFFTKVFGHSDDEWMKWYHHFIHAGFKALEGRLAEEKETGVFCHGHFPTMADICLVPQVYNAKRFGVDLSKYPTVRKINKLCLLQTSFMRASPEKQTDAVY